MWRTSLGYYRCYCSARATTIWAKLANTWPRLALCLRRDRGETNCDPSTRLTHRFLPAFQLRSCINRTGRKKVRTLQEREDKQTNEAGGGRHLPGSPRLPILPRFPGGPAKDKERMINPSERQGREEKRSLLFNVL